MPITYRRVRASELDESLIEAWRSLQRASAHLASPCFCPEFTQLASGARDDVWVLVLEQEGRPVGFFPFQRGRAGVGRPAAGPLSDYHGPILRPETALSVEEMVRAAGLSVWAFDHVPAGISALEPHAWARSGSPCIDLSSGFEAYVERFRARDSDYVIRAERMARKIEREVGPLRFTLHEDDDRVVQQVFDWKDTQYLDSGSPAVFRDHPWAGRFVRAVARHRSEHFSGVCSTLRVGDRLLAAHIGMRSGSVLHWWFPTYEVALERYSPGTLLLLRLAQAACGAGVRLLDLGKGESRYKRSTMTHEVPLLEGAVEVASWRGRWRRFRRAVEAKARGGGILARGLDLPLRGLRRREHRTRFR